MKSATQSFVLALSTAVVLSLFVVPGAVFAQLRSHQYIPPPTYATYTNPVWQTPITYTSPSAVQYQTRPHHLVDDPMLWRSHHRWTWNIPQSTIDFSKPLPPIDWNIPLSTIDFSKPLPPIDWNIPLSTIDFSKPLPPIDWNIPQNTIDFSKPLPPIDWSKFQSNLKSINLTPR